LIDVIRDWIERGTTIISDCWADITHRSMKLYN
jgi:hypothetical protein